MHTTGPRAGGGPRIDVVGLGPAGPELITTGAQTLMAGAETLVLRTARHPSARAVPDAPSFDHLYEGVTTFEEVYSAIVDELVSLAKGRGSVVYAVPGSPAVAERSVVLLRDHPLVVDGDLAVNVHPAVSFVDLAVEVLGVDPVSAGVALVDGESFSVEAAGSAGPLLVAQCWSRSVLSAIKISVDVEPTPPVTILHHLGLDDEVVREVPWEELDRAIEPDHLTSLWIPELAAPVASELVRLDELVRVLRARCPWDRDQTHGSLARHLLEECYELLEAIEDVTAMDAAPAEGRSIDAAHAERRSMDAAPAEHRSAEEEMAVSHLEEELGDVLFQVYFHALLATEAGRFTLADVARGVHDKLVARHPHVFGEASAETPEQLAASWESLKRTEKNRTSVTEGIPDALPSLALANKLQRKALAVGVELPTPAQEVSRIIAALAGNVPTERAAPERAPEVEEASPTARRCWVTSCSASRTSPAPWVSTPKAHFVCALRAPPGRRSPRLTADTPAGTRARESDPMPPPNDQVRRPPNGRFLTPSTGVTTHRERHRTSHRARGARFAGEPDRRS